MPSRLQRTTRIALVATVLATGAAGPVSAVPCAFEAEGEGRVAAVIDARSFRLTDGRDVRLAGIEPAFPEKPGAGRGSCFALRKRQGLRRHASGRRGGGA